MKRILTMTGAAVIALSAAAASQAQPGPPPGKGEGRSEARSEDRGPPGRGRADERGRDNRNDAQESRDDPRRDLAEARRELDREWRQEERRNERRDVERTVERAVIDAAPMLVFERRPDRGLIQGCPPGLARQNAGCMPPGQLRQIERRRHAYLLDRWDDRYDYRYSDGYLYRMNDEGGLLGYLPLLGGALGLGSIWPAQYDYQPAPDYYGSYYGLNDRYDYRYADGVLYGVDPQTQAINTVAALLTGQSWSVGQAMPAGYDVYNVPYAYRDRYPDTPDRMRRYSDGYVYEIDPTTRLVQAAIQLLT